ncbi:LTA synthase family protein [Helicobacter cappadocius]|uniref:LTA synthase family protein n=1 Tax=Helicobacter cappadocius TaxID=3063998 RepID=A0ABT8Z3A2_9HELI|nr:LTA synthase family protein [Helicobacter sp. faydin-H75]MDO7252993.1 LTA synthase family protein [Helicobacter sp. faydin-H75]
MISESFSDWAFDPVFDKIGLTSGLKSLIDNKHGFKLAHFLENAPCTTRSLGVQLTGIPQTDFLLYKLLGRFSLFETAPGNIFHQLGYESTFYYGGYSVWGEFAKIATIEGFDKTYDAINVLKFAKGKNYQKHIQNEWGVHDNILFDFIGQKVSLSSKPTFNMIMTSSVHPPYDVDLNYFDVPIQKIQNFWKENFPKNKITNGMDANILGHIWWYDKQVTHFILKMSQVFPDSLFVITADHYGRISPIPTNKPSITHTVPFILYSPVLSPKQLANIGSHIDITPTIVELVSPKGFVYHSFGTPLFSNNHTLSFQRNKIALGFEVIGNEQFLYTPDFGLEYFTTTAQKRNIENDEDLAKEIYQKQNELDDLSLYLLIKGHIIK